MMTLYLNGTKMTECDRAEKGADFITCYQDGAAVLKASGITDFSAFTLEGGSFEEAPDPIDVDQLKEQIAFLQQQVDILTGGAQ